MKKNRRITRKRTSSRVLLFWLARFTRAAIWENMNFMGRLTMSGCPRRRPEGLDRREDMRAYHFFPGDAKPDERWPVQAGQRMNQGGRTIELVSKPRITVAGKAQADPKAQQPLQVVSTFERPATSPPAVRRGYEAGSMRVGRPGHSGQTAGNAVFTRPAGTGRSRT
jgi:hypothetical protein